MRLTIDIEDNKLDEVLSATGMRKKSPAVVATVGELGLLARDQQFEMIREAALPGLRLV